MSRIIIKLNEGGPFFTYPMLILFFVILFIFTREMIKKDNFSKTIDLLKSLGWFAIVWAFLGHTIGLISAFDSIANAGEISLQAMAPGLKIALLNPLYGAFVFLVARTSIIFLILSEKKT